MKYIENFYIKCAAQKEEGKQQPDEEDPDEDYIMY